jgi:hypothetical protein
MHLRELISEAINISHYDSLIDAALREGIENFFKGSWLRTQFSDLPSPILAKRIDSLTIFDPDQLEEEIARKLANSLVKKLNSQLGKDYIEGIRFDPIKNRGQVRGYFMELSEDAFLTPILKSLKTGLLQFLLDNNLVHEVSPDDPDISKNQRENYYYFYKINFDRIFTMLDRYQKELSERIWDSVPREEKNAMIDTVIHETVHVIQHRKQSHRGHDTEYRSYLDTRKGEFQDLARGEEVRWEDPRWDRLYYASPQEIPAFAHAMAQKVIRELGYDEEPEYFLQGSKLTVPFAAGDFLRAFETVVGGRYRDPRNPREQKILKRYLKLAYQGVQSYIEQRIKDSQKNSQEKGKKSS